MLAVVPDPGTVPAETERVLAPGGRAAVYDEFVPEDADPPLLPRALAPDAWFLFSDVTRQLGPVEPADPRDRAPRMARGRP